jgi:hypothetical protein
MSVLEYLGREMKQMANRMRSKCLLKLLLIISHQISQGRSTIQKAVQSIEWVFN